MSDIIQGSSDWVNLRLGKVTASRVSDVVAKVKTGWGASRANYMAELLVERLTGVQQDTYQNAAMQWGNDHEAEARASYEFMTGNDVELVGFIPHPTIAMSGASPDGLVGVDGLVELKCPQSATHIDTLLTGKVPAKYVTQMLWQMACSGRAWCDWVSYDPRLPVYMQLFIRRVQRDDQQIASLEKDVIEFLEKLDEQQAGLIKLYGGGVKVAA